MARKSRRALIVQAAAELFASKGFQKTTVRDIAEQAGVLSGSLYAHIETKEDLFLEIVRLAARHFEQALAPIVASSLSPSEKLRHAVKAHIGVIDESRAWAQVYLSDVAELSDEARQEARRLRRQYEAYWIKILHEGVAAGVFSIEDETLTRFFVLSGLNGMTHWYRAGGRLTCDEIADIYANLIERMLQPTDRAGLPPDAAPSSN
jgi:AcrR family transcriptional regulator